MAPRAGLTSDRVVDAAMVLADDEGLDRVTLARVAGRLGVKPPSLYEHIDGLEGLRSELRIRGLETMASLFRRATTGRSKDDAVRALADAFRRFAREHPALYEATVRSVERDTSRAKAAGEDVLDILFAVLRGYGIKGEEAVHATRYLRSVLHGFNSLEAAGGFGMPTDLERSYRRMIDALLATLGSWSELRG